MHVKDPQLSVVRVGHCALLACAEQGCQYGSNKQTIKIKVILNKQKYRNEMGT